MNLGDPRKRKPIHEKVPLDEISDNVKNNAVLTSSRSKKKYNLSDSSDEEISDSEDVGEQFETYVLSCSPPMRNSRSNLHDIRRQKLKNQSPKAYKRQLHINNLSHDISDDENWEESKRNRSYEINRSNGIGRNLNHFGSNYEVIRRFDLSPRYEPETNYEQCKPETRYKSYSNVSRESRLSSKILNESSSKKINERTSNSNGIYFLLVVIIVGLALYFAMNRTNSVDLGNQTEAFSVDRKSEILNDVLITFRNLKSKYKNQNRDLWLDAYSSIASLINQEDKKPSIIVLLGNKSDPLECLARLIGNVSSKALRSDRLLLTPKEFETDMGSVIQTMRSHLQDKKAIIVSDLLNINIEALKAFHNLCDRINPLVDEAIYIITVIADDYDDNSNPLQYIENQLHKKLDGKMKEDAIQPLITRLTDGPILTVKPEPTVTDCSL